MSATWRAVARKDLADAGRSKLLWAVIAVFVAFVAMALPVAEQLFPPTVAVGPREALAGVAMLAQLFVPGIALVAGYMAVAGERRSGSLRVLLGFPFSRRDVVLGKLAGRLTVTVTGLLVGFAVASGLVVALYGVPDLLVFGGFVAAGVLLGVAFTGLAVGGSAAAASRGRAMALTVGSFVAMVFFWKPVAAGSYYLLHGSLPGIPVESWYLLVKRLNPLEAYRVVTAWVLEVPVSAVPRFPVEDVPASGPFEQVSVATRLGGDVPLYLQDWVAVVVLLAWAVVPVAVGYWWFERADLE